MDKLPENKTIDTTPDSGTFFNTLRNSLETKLAKFSAALLITLGTLSLSACANDREPAAEEPSVSQEAVEETTAPNPAEVEATEPVLDTHEFVGVELEQQITFEEMEAMSVSDFAKLPFADRYSYAFDKIKNSYPSTNESTDPLDDYPELIPGYFWQPAFAISSNDADPNTRAKLAGAYRYYTTEKGDGEISSTYQSTIDSVQQIGGEGIGIDYVFGTTDHGKLQHGFDRDGVPIDFMNFTYRGGPGESYETAPEQTAQAIRTKIKMLNGETVIFYPIGYGTEGRKSPVEAYPY